MSVFSPCNVVSYCRILGLHVYMCGAMVCMLCVSVTNFAKLPTNLLSFNNAADQAPLVDATRLLSIDMFLYQVFTNDDNQTANTQIWILRCLGYQYVCLMSGKNMET